MPTDTPDFVILDRIESYLFPAEQLERFRRFTPWQRLVWLDEARRLTLCGRVGGKPPRSPQPPPG